MKTFMLKMSAYTVDIARDPAKAIKEISDPILDLLNIKVEEFDKRLKLNMAGKQECTA